MNLTLTRTHHLQDSTLGVLTIESTSDHRTLFCCATLEPPVVAKGPIPSGTYMIKWQWSNRYQRQMPFLQNVPGFTGIMIHTGNTHCDTRGCILVGMSSCIHDNQGRLLSSVSAFRELELNIRKMSAPVYITIIDKA